MTLRSTVTIDGAELAALLDWRTAIDALAGHLTGEAPAAPPFPRTAFPCSAGEVLLMPAETSRHVGVKIVSLNHDAPAGTPRAQGIYSLMDARSLSPVALLDAVTLTTIRTAAVSALAVDRLAPPDAARLVVLGTGPQSSAHALAVAAVRPLSDVRIVGRRPDAVAAVVAQLREAGLPASAGAVDDVRAADVVCCCTASPQPLFDSRALTVDATVVAMGSHHPDRREVDEHLVRDGFVIVESRENALREAGDILMAGDDPSSLIDADLAELVSGRAMPGPGRRLFKSVGEAWEDLVLAAAAYERVQA